jgi:hypothetical protein
VGCIMGGTTLSEEWEGGGVRRSVLAVAAGRQRPKASGCGRCRPMRGVGGTTAQNRRVGSLTCGASATVPRFKPI